MMPHFAASQLRLLRAVECSNNLRGVYFKSHPSEIGQQQSNCCDYALPALSVSERCGGGSGNLGQDQWRTEMLTASVLTQIQINNNNNRNNNNNMKQTSHIEQQTQQQQQQQQRAESAMLSTSTANGVSLPEMPVAADHKFPLTSELKGKYLNREIQSAAQQPQQQPQQKYAAIPFLYNGKFPLLQPKCVQNFPLRQEQQTAAIPAVMQARARFPANNIMNQLVSEQRFPVMCRRPKRNFNYTIQSVQSTASPPHPPQIYKTFPTIKKQFVSFFNNQAGGCKRIPHGVEASELPTDVQATVTQTSHKMVTEIDIETKKNNVAVAVAAAAAVAATVVDVDDVDDVRTAPFDNELNAHVQTLNLNVVEETEGVGERKEIEHQQAENFNDAFGRNKDATGEGDGDAMNAAASVGFFAKNKREICEQSRLEIRAHNELNMTKERQSICLASEQSQRQTTIDEAVAAAAVVVAAGAAVRAAASNRHSDARESSSEQVDGQQRQQIDTALSTNVTQTESQQTQPEPQPTPAAPSVSTSSLSSRETSVESSRCAVRELLDETSASCVAEADLDLFDLLGDLLLQLITKTTRTGNFWSEQQQQEEQQQQHPLPGECVDMTVSKVSEDSEATVAVAVEIEEQPIELDESNSSISTPSLDMKYEVMRSSSSRLPLAESLPSRLVSAATTATPAAAATIAPAPTSRIRDAALPISTTPTTRPLLGELKRNSSSRDDVSIDVDSLLPERTRLRRQRRMRSQESVEEKPEDVIERLNKLKARISASLSEVKGVLKQYSTESEAEAAGEKWLGPPAPPAAPAPASSESKEQTTEPVQFRFVRKVRRRSYFDEADEDKEQLKEDGSAKEQTASKEPAKPMEKETKESKAEDKLEQKEKTITEKEKLAAKNDEEQQKQKAEAAEVEKQVSKTKENEAKPQPKPAEKDKVQAKIEFLAKVQSELKSTKKKEEKPKEANAGSEQLQKQAASQNEAKQKEPAATTTTAQSKKQQQPIEAVEAATAAAAAALPTAAAAQPAAAAASGAETIVSTVPPHQPKKKIIIKSKNPRRASIAAVEPSKIVPETVQLDVLTQRRPSDSETIVKRKKKLKLTSVATPTATTSGSTAATAATATEKATSATTAVAATANEQLVAAEVNSKASAAKNADEDDNAKKKQTAAAAATAAATATPAAAATAAPATAAATATAAIEQVEEPKAPLELAVDGVANRAAASEQNRRASLKLAELVGETVLVPAAAAATATATTATVGAAAAAATTASPVHSGESKEPINQCAGAAAEAALPQVVAAAAIDVAVVVAANADIEVAPVVVDDASAPQIAATLSQAPCDESSPHQQQQDQQQDQQQQQQQQQEHAVAATKDRAQEQPQSSLATMPELKVLTGPVQPVKIETVEQHVEPHDESETGVVSKKKTPHLKKLVRKSSIDKGKEKIGEQSSKLSNILKDKNKISDIADRMNKQTPPKKQSAKQAKEQVQQENIEVAPTVDEQPESQPEPEPEPAPAPKPKKPRQIKKKVIIKRQKRRLSIGDTFFIQQEPEEPKVPEIETIEKAIAYVTDDEDEDLEPLPEPEPVKPLKSCLHVREYKIGDLILYAERYRKTQVRWKRGRILERITSISYKLEIEGKEVPAHISYIKKYTGRKVKFVGKEYLDIDYEQVVEEERRARSYSIWNMV